MPSKLSLTLVAAAVFAAPAQAAPTADEQAVYALADACRTVAGASDGSLSFKPTGLGTFLLTDAAGQLVGEGPGLRSGGPETAGPAAEWQVRRTAPDTFTLTSTAGKGGLVVGPDGRLALAARAAPLRLAAATGCTPFPEADLGASGTPARSRNADGSINGWADTHLHMTGDMRAGGSVMGGEPFDRFGIVRALADTSDHGPDGGLDATGNLLRDGVPFGTHDVGGWPAFSGWPTNDTNTHTQLYHRWLQRAHLAGLRLVVAEIVEDEIICAIEPRRRYSCDETAAIKGQIARLRALQDYVDAQHGGPGKGWMRIVTSPAAARKAAAAGQTAVVIGVESSFPLDCKAEGRPCTKRQVDQRLEALHRLGVRSMFVAHWADNGFAGAAIEGGVKGKFINAMQRVSTGRWFDVERCTDPSQGEEITALSKLEIDVVSQFFPATAKLKTAKLPTYGKGRWCNVRGLTRLGRHLVRRMMRKGMLVEMDHMSEKAREEVLDIAARERTPVVSGHNHTGGHWTSAELRRLARVGGLASQRLDDAAPLARAIVARRRVQPSGVGLGTDTGGFATLPGRTKGAALAYPFRLNGVTFERQVTGTRTFDVNVDGVAHYGLLPDLLADMARRPSGREAHRLLFRSAEAYVRMWERAERR